jgi:signal transduction histidine kinase
MGVRDRMERDRLAIRDVQPSDSASESSDANERRSSFLGFVAHEVRNPLSTALWTAELLARMSAAERGGPRGEKLSAMCLRSLVRVRQLVEDHFLCERLDVSGIPVRFESFSLRELMEGIVERRPPGAPPVEIDVDPALAVEADRSLLERGLDSLVAAATREDGPIRLSAVADEVGMVRIAVRGPKPVDAALEDPRKGSPSDARGRALALPVARRAAEALGGSLVASDDGYVLTLARVAAYTPPAEPSARS